MHIYKNLEDFQLLSASNSRDWYDKLIKHTWRLEVARMRSQMQSVICVAAYHTACRSIPYIGEAELALV